MGKEFEKIVQYLQISCKSCLKIGSRCKVVTKLCVCNSNTSRFVYLCINSPFQWRQKNFDCFLVMLYHFFE